MRLIDADVLIKRLDNHPRIRDPYGNECLYKCDVLAAVCNQPTIKAKEFAELEQSACVSISQSTMQLNGG